MGSEMDFQLDWDLPAYPQLPKMFTNAKAAKKRKHREFVMTDADLEHVVKIPRAATGALAALYGQHWRPKHLQPSIEQHCPVRPWSNRFQMALSADQASTAQVVKSNGVSFESLSKY